MAKKSGAKKRSASQRSSAQRSPKRSPKRRASGPRPAKKGERADLSQFTIDRLKKIDHKSLLSNAVKDLRAFAKQYHIPLHGHKGPSGRRVPPTKLEIVEAIHSFAHLPKPKRLTPDGSGGFVELAGLTRRAIGTYARRFSIRRSGSRKTLLKNIASGEKVKRGGRPKGSGAKKSAKRSASPAKRSASPAKRSASPAKRSASPAKRSASPAKRSASPAKRGRGRPKKSPAPAKKAKRGRPKKTQK